MDFEYKLIYIPVFTNNDDIGIIIPIQQRFQDFLLQWIKFHIDYVIKEFGIITNYEFTYSNQEMIIYFNVVQGSTSEQIKKICHFIVYAQDTIEEHIYIIGNIDQFQDIDIIAMLGSTDALFLSKHLCTGSTDGISKSESIIVNHLNFTFDYSKASTWLIGPQEDHYGKNCSLQILKITYSLL